MKQNAITNLKKSAKKSEDAKTFFFQVENEFTDLEKSYIRNRFKKCLSHLEHNSDLVNEFSLEDLLTFLKKQNNLTQAGEIVNTILIAKIKTLILKQ